MKPTAPPHPDAVDATRRAFLGAAVAAPVAAVGPTAAAAVEPAPPAPTSPTAARYRDTERVREYYRLAGY